MNDSINKLIIGGGGIAATEVAEQAMAMTPVDITSTGNLIIQIVIGLVTLFGLFKKRKK